MSFGIGVLIGAVGMLLLQLGLLSAFTLRAVFKGFRKEMKCIEAAEETNS